MPVIPSVSLSPSVFSPPAAPPATVESLAFAAAQVTSVPLPPVGSASPRDRSPTLDARLAQLLSADLRSAGVHVAARTRRSIYDHPVVNKTLTNLFYEMSAANARGVGPLSNRELLSRLIEQAPEDGISQASIPRLMAYRLPSLLLTEDGFEPGTMNALYYNLGKLRSFAFRQAPPPPYVAEGRALLDGLIAMDHEEHLVAELSRRSNVAVMVHAKANNVSGLENWAASDGYPQHLIAARAVVLDHVNHERGEPTVVEAQIEARRVVAGNDTLDSAL